MLTDWKSSRTSSLGFHFDMFVGCPLAPATVSSVAELLLVFECCDVNSSSGCSKSNDDVTLVLEVWLLCESSSENTNVQVFAIRDAFLYRPYFVLQSKIH